jgi:hypothetical protein
MRKLKALRVPIHVEVFGLDNYDLGVLSKREAKKLI